jgi:hypothetical protein
VWCFRGRAWTGRAAGAYQPRLHLQSKCPPLFFVSGGPTLPDSICEELGRAGYRPRISINHRNHFTFFQCNLHRATADAPVKEMCCKEWWNILERYQRSVQAYSDSVRGLNELSCVDLSLAWMEAERARKNCDVCRSQLFEHEYEHCKRVSSITTPPDA